jgi:hypothetical protein
MRLFAPDTEQNRTQQLLAARAIREAHQRAELRRSLEYLIWTGLAIVGVFAASVGSLIFLTDLIPQ